jgi:hypothetical protein
MMAFVRLLLLPLRAPMLLWLLAVSVYLGLNWSHPFPLEADQGHPFAPLVWSAQCLQALMVVVVCCMPDLLLRRFSVMLAASRVVTLVATLLLVTIGGLYLLHLDVFSNVLILATSVLLARLDLVRIRVVPPPAVLAMMLALLVLGGANLGHLLDPTLTRAASQQINPLQAIFKPQRISPSLKRIPILGRVTPPSKPTPHHR